MRLRTTATLLALFLAACGAPAAPRTQPVAAPTPSPAAPVLEVLAPAHAEALEALCTRLETQLEELHLPGFALAVVEGDELILARGFGFADVEEQEPVTPETLFAIGSTTKAFTATLVGMLADEHALAFDDPITKALPWFSLPTAGGEGVTFRDLLSHRTGFARMDMLWHGTGVDAEEILRTALRAEPLVPFRKEFQYNNIMYLAAGRACAEVTGQSWQDLIRARFFEPLGMTSSDTSTAEAQADPRLAHGYAWNAAETRFVPVPMVALESIAPAGAINSNVLDLSRWVRFQLGRGEFEGRRLVSAESFAETWKTHNQLSPGVRYGLGWFLRDWRGQPYIEHGGNIDGFAAEIALLPEAGIGVAFLCNVGATPLQGSIGPQVFEALLGPAEEAEAALPAAEPGEDLARYTGTYLANYFQFKDAKFEVLERNGRLAIDIPGQAVFELLPPDANGKRAFALIPQEIQADFLEQDGRVVALLLYQGGMEFEIPRPDWEPEAELDPSELEPYLGSYADPLTKKTFAVIVSRHRLAVDYPEQMVYELFPPRDDERWFFRATEQMALEFQLDADGRAEAVTFHERGTQRLCERVGEGDLTLPTREELLALRKGAAFEARLAELGPCRLDGSMRFVHCGIQGPMRTTFDASGAYVEVVDLRPFLWTQTAFDGEHGRTRAARAGESELQGAHLDQTRANGPAALFGDWGRRFEHIEIVRVDEERDRRTLRVKLRSGAAPALVAHVDLTSGDLVRAELSELVDGSPPVNRTVTFEDWRDFAGLRLPARMVSEDPNVGRIVVEYATLTPAPGPETFALPPALEK